MQFLTSSVWLDTLTETLHANFSFCPQQSCSLSLLAAQVMCHSPPHQPPTHIDTLLIAQLWREVLKNAPAFIAHPGDASSVTVSATLTRCPVLLFICFSSPLLLRAHLSTLCDLMCSPPPLYLWGKLFENKGNTAQRGVIVWNTINVILYVLQRFIFFLLPFLTVYDFFLWELCVNLYACGSFCLFLSILYVCVCYKRDYFQFTYLITQQKDRSSVRDSVSSVCTLYDCMPFVFLPDLSSATFFFLSPSLNFCDYSKELHSTFWAGVSYYKTVVPLETVNF